jgi:FkbM family methyltransferase
VNNEHILVQVLLRSWPFPRGAGRILDKYFSKLSFSRPTAVVLTTDGFDITVIPNELIGRHIYLTGEFDRSIVEVLCAFSEPGDALLDIGANIGYVSSCFLNNVSNSSVIAVEPQPEVLEILATNLGRLGRNQIYPFALAESDGEAWFQIDRSNMGAGRIVEASDSRTVKIQTRGADSMFSDLHIEKLDLVKIDAEGFEKAIISACLNHFERLQPRAILFEDTALDVTEIARLLQKVGYRTFGIRKSLTSLTLQDIGQLAHDYIAISNRREIPERAKKTYRI